MDSDSNELQTVSIALCGGSLPYIDTCRWQRQSRAMQESEGRRLCCNGSRTAMMPIRASQSSSPPLTLATKLRRVPKAFWKGLTLTLKLSLSIEGNDLDVYCRSARGSAAVDCRCNIQPLQARFGGP